MGDDSSLSLSKMYQNWFLDYASYVILERAVPHISDGLKPVQRRILHAMRRMDDGRYNKVANVIGNTMQFHPHGDASIGDALVQLGQKEMLIDCQGNWLSLIHICSIALLEELVPFMKGTAYAEESLYLLAQSHYNSRDYFSATQSFTTYYTSYPKGEYAESALFYSAYGMYLDSPDSRLDQSKTYTAIIEFQKYIERYPQTCLLYTSRCV